MTGLGSVGPIWLDVTRLVSRVGRGVSTGIDRVELAYLDHLLAIGGRDTRFFCKTTRGFLVLGPDGGTCLAALVRGETPPGGADWISRLSLRGARPRHRAEAALRRLAVNRCLSSRLPRMLARSFPAGAIYLNTGHSNLSERVLGAFSDHNARIVVLIHDLIPLTHPDTVVPDLPANFAGRIAWVRTCADLVICNSAATEADLLTHWPDDVERPETVVAHLGVEMAPHSTQQKDPKAFVMLGTIEARKNHALMLDVWEALARDLPEEDLPHLHIIGPRGWRVGDLLQRLDTHPLKNRAIFEHGALPEAEMQTRLASAQALLFPSIAEGYGYPPLEASALGTLPIVSDLPVLREVLDARAVYVPVNDAYSWTETIKKHVDGKVRVPTSARAPNPDWNSHFAKVADALERKQV